jgi:hypothetical protein
LNVALCARFEVVNGLHGSRQEAEAAVEKAAKRLLKRMTPGLKLLGLEVSFFDPADVSISYVPEAIRDHFESAADAVQEILEDVTDEELYDAAVCVLQGDAVWQDFHRNCLSILRCASGGTDETP